MWNWKKKPPNIPEIRMEILDPSEEVPAQPILCQELSTTPTGQESTQTKKNSLSDQKDVQQISPVSPTPSTDRLSVSFGPEVFSFGGSSTRSSTGSSVRLSMISSPDSNPSDTRVRFSKDYLITNTDENDDDDDDYNANLEAMLQRRYSKRRGSVRRSPSRRLSSPFGSDMEKSRRRSSTMTTASGETQISMEEDIAEEEIMENIRMHKEVLDSVKTQAWRTRKKLKVARQAKAYVKKHEGLLEQRLAQSKSTKDIMARYKLIFFRHSAKLHRELSNLAAQLIPWENRIKRIECHFGSNVATYFTFLRWIFWINIIISIMIACFIIIPEVLAADRSTAGDRKELLPSEEDSAFNLHSIWEFEGWLKYSPIFYGYYTDKDKTKAGYRLPFAYFMASIGMYAYSFWVILKKMAKNSRMSKLSEKDEECTFTWKLFSGWDYMIGNSETSQNKVASLIMGFKEVVLEEQEKQKEGKNWKIIALRVLAFFLVVCLLVASAYAVVMVVERSQQPDGESGWWRKNELQIVLNGISTIYPNIFEIIGMMEYYHPRLQLQIQLARIWVLNMLNLYTLNLALFDKVEKMSINLTSLMPNTTTTSTTTFYSTTIFNSTTRHHNATEKPITQATDDFDPTGLHANCTRVIVPCEYVNSSNLPTYAIDNVTDQNVYINNTLDIWSYFDGNAIFSHLPNLTDILNRTSGPLSINTSISIANNDTNWISNQLEFSAKINPSLKSMSLIFLPPELLEKYNLTNTSMDYNFSLPLANETDFVEQNYTDYTETLINIITDWISTTVLPDLIDVKNVTVLITSSVRSDENNEIPTLEPSSVHSTMIPINLTDSTPKVCFQIVCPETVDYTEPDINGETELVTWITTQSMEASNFSSSSCENCTDYVTPEDLTTIGYELDMETRIKLRKLCWETMFGQEIVRLTIMDLVFSCLMSFIMDFFRAVFVRVMNKCWCWDLEKQFPGYGDFKIAENILHLINNQGMIWMGTFFSPGLPIINAGKLVILFYIRSWAVLTCNVPHETVFRASRSNNFYYALLLTMLFLCTLPVSYAVIWLKPSWHCGPFSGYIKIYHILTQSVKKVMPDVVNRALDYLTSASIVIPLMLLLILIIYYLLSLARSLREANKDLKDQLRRERTEERKKVFQMADGTAQNGQQPGTDMASKWPAVMKKILPVLPNKKTLPDVEKLKQDSEDSKDENEDDKKKKIQSRLILMSDDDIFIETENDTLITKDDNRKKKDKKSAEVPTITISKVKDEEKNDKKKSKIKEDKKKEEKDKKNKEVVKSKDNKKDEKKPKEDKKSKKNGKDKKSEEEPESDKKLLLEKDKKKKKDEKSKKDELKRQKEEEKQKKEAEKKKKEEEKKRKDEEKRKKDEEKKKKDDKTKIKDDKLKEKSHQEKTEKKDKTDEKPEENKEDEEEPQILPKPIEPIIKTEEIEMELINQEEIESESEDVKQESDTEESKSSTLKGDGIFEKDTMPLVIEFGTPSSLGSIRSSIIKPEDEYDESDRTVLIQNEHETGRESPSAEDGSPKHETN